LLSSGLLSRVKQLLFIAIYLITIYFICIYLYICVEYAFFMLFFFFSRFNSAIHAESRPRERDHEIIFNVSKWTCSVLKWP